MDSSPCWKQRSVFPNPLHHSHPCSSDLISYHQTGKRSYKIVSHLHTWALSVTQSAFLFFFFFDIHFVTSLAPNGNSGTVRSYFVHCVCVCTEKSRAFSWASGGKKRKKVNVTFPLGLQLSYRSTAEEGESTVQASAKVERVRPLSLFITSFFFCFLPFASPLLWEQHRKDEQRNNKTNGSPREGLV